jgi:hypothetical protein
MLGYLITGLYFREFVIVVAWSCTLYKHVANMQSDRTKQSHKTVQYFVYSHIQEENSTSAIPRGFQYAQHLVVIVSFKEHSEKFDATF